WRCGKQTALPTSPQPRRRRRDILAHNPRNSNYDWLRKTGHVTDNYEAMIRLVVKERLLLLALNDLIVPISHFNLATINCARAIEALRTAISVPGQTRERGWELMRKHLNLTKNYLDFVIDLSKEPRHGNRKAPEVGQQAEVLKRAWTIMNRFLEFRKRGNIPLPLSKFRLL
ncbi:MAG: hypothetical protein WAM66_10480, partial [Acidobacteriaceae bacterium]